MDVEFHDWEVLHSSDGSGTANSSDSDEATKCLEGIEGDSEGIIRADYFSLDSQAKYTRRADDDVADDGSVESDNPSWVDPGSVTRSPRNQSGEHWSDSSSNPSEDRRIIEFEQENHVGIANTQVGFHEIGEVVAESDNSAQGVGDFVQKDELGEKYLIEGGEKRSDEIETMKADGEKEVRSMVWWKLPVEFFRYCVLRVSPVWTLSVAAAMMGAIILGRRLYKMKRKSQSLKLKVTMDEKKVSQFMSRAARLNEAFSIVKRVPVIRPSMPAAGVTPWPVMSLR
ncbi:hypothetical protein RJ640_021079 [Escallonia rubra]|uniref:DUF6821 domain-containing protein n=1 Tax=Escallonia rubra TaxID=112253 RepID=A0AA88QR39_9ASTE|nr:hypothetical protein RJ640_021079 [Escallonia rubra]